MELSQSCQNHAWLDANDTKNVNDIITVPNECLKMLEELY